MRVVIQFRKSYLLVRLKAIFLMKIRAKQTQKCMLLFTSEYLISLSFKNEIIGENETRRN